MIVGAAGGMGKAIAHLAARNAAGLALLARDAGALDALCHEVSAENPGLQVIGIITNAADPAAIIHAVQQALLAFGRIDTLINAVGLNITNRALDKLTHASWNEMVSANLDAAFHLTQAIVPVMRGQKGGLIIHIASIAARKPDMSGLAYQATKAGVVALAYATMEEERANGIRVTSILPGMTNTPLLNKRSIPVSEAARLAALQPAHIAATCAYVMALDDRVHVSEILLQPAT